MDNEEQQNVFKSVAVAAAFGISTFTFAGTVRALIVALVAFIAALVLLNA